MTEHNNMRAGKVILRFLIRVRDELGFTATFARVHHILSRSKIKISDAPNNELHSYFSRPRVRASMARGLRFLTLLLCKQDQPLSSSSPQGFDMSLDGIMRSWYTRRPFQFSCFEDCLPQHRRHIEELRLSYLASTDRIATIISQVLEKCASRSGHPACLRAQYAGESSHLVGMREAVLKLYSYHEGLCKYKNALKHMQGLAEADGRVYQEYLKNPQKPLEYLKEHRPSEWTSEPCVAFHPSRIWNLRKMHNLVRVEPQLSNITSGMCNLSIALQICYDPLLRFKCPLDEKRRLVIECNMLDKHGFQDDFWNALLQDMLAGPNKRPCYERFFKLLKFIRNEMACWCIPYIDEPLQLLLVKNVKNLLGKKQFDFAEKRKLLLESMLALISAYSYNELGEHATDITIQYEHIKSVMDSSRRRSHTREFVDCLRILWESVMQTKDFFVESKIPCMSWSAVHLARVLTMQAVQPKFYEAPKEVELVRSFISKMSREDVEWMSHKKVLGHMKVVEGLIMHYICEGWNPQSPLPPSLQAHSKRLYNLCRNFQECIMIASRVSYVFTKVFFTKRPHFLHFCLSLCVQGSTSGTLLCTTCASMLSFGRLEVYACDSLVNL